MTFDELQNKWESQGNFKLNIDSNILLNQVRRNKQDFEATIFWRDFRETIWAPVMALLCLFYWLRFGFWQLSILFPGILFVTIFIIADRKIQKKRQLNYSETLVGCVENTISQIDHQTWLLRNVLWWYLAPLFSGIFILLIYATWEVKDAGFFGYFVCSSVLLVCILLYIHIYYENQKAVEKELDPRKGELQELLESLLNGEG